MKLMAMLLVLALALTAQPVQEIQKVLKATNATWSAEESWVTRMSPIEQEALLGLLPGIMDIANLPVSMDYAEEVTERAFEVPSTSIKNQGGCGSCYSFGASATYEGYCLLKGLGTFDLSEQDFMMKAKAIGPYGGCNGWYLDTSMNLLKNQGVTDEACCPYKGYEAACASCTAKHKITSFVVTTDLNTIKANLAKYGPGYCGFAVYGDFMSYSSGVYRLAANQSLKGYHAVTIVGYDDSLQCFKVKNSWGTGWGEKGFFRVGYDQMNNAVKFGTCFGGVFFVTGK